MPLTKNAITQSATIVAIAAGIKTWYSMASVNDLWIVLTPTAWLVGLITGESFMFEAYAGYMNADHTFLIAAACSGINFWIAAFLMLAILRLWNRSHAGARAPLPARVGTSPAEPESNGVRYLTAESTAARAGRGARVPARGSWAVIPAGLVVTYLATIIANTVRISIALMMHRSEHADMWFDPDQAHRLEGIVVYFGFLLLLFFANQWFEDRANPRSEPASFTRGRIVLPLAIYWVTTLGIPIANGAYRQGAAFWEHMGFVLVAPLALMLPLALIWACKTISLAKNRKRRRCEVI